MDETLTASEVCAAAKCPPSSLRAWQNRNGLLPHLAREGGWRRYSLADVLAVRLVVLLTQRGLSAQDAVNVVNQMRETIELAAHGVPILVGVGSTEGGIFAAQDSDGAVPAYEFRELKSTSSVWDNIGWFYDPIVTVFDLGRITKALWAEIRISRGHASLKIILPKNEGGDK